jgi:sugar (pentulose or hexulose) kinase
MTGGVAKNRAAVHYIEKVLGLPVILPGNPQVAGALGAALLALDDYRAMLKDAAAPPDDDALDAQLAVGGSCAPACTGSGIKIEAKIAL